MTTSSGVPEARCDAPQGAPGDARSAGPSCVRPGAHDDLTLEACLYVVQGALDGLARPLAETEFVVVDLETTGGSPADAAITEIGAVRTRGTLADWPGMPGNPEMTGGRRMTDAPGAAGSPGVASGGPGAAGDPGAAHGSRLAAHSREFTTLVNPGRAIPPHVAALTGITDALVTAAPRIEEVLPQFIEFAAGSVLVAHNAPFDIGFLRAACAQHNLAWPALPTLDTAALARRMLTTDEVHDCRLGTLADFFCAGTRPSHRALDDARATTAVLHGLLGRLARRGVHTLEALRGFGLPPAPQRRRMRNLTAAIPRAPGVCMFTAADGQVLHVVRSSDMHARACGYFTTAETRGAIREMISKTRRIVPLRCATVLEAEVTEIRLIAMHLPPFGTDMRASAAGWRCPAAAGPVKADALAAVREVVAARPRFSGGWDVAWIRRGLLEATAILPRGAEPQALDIASGAVMPCAIGLASQAAASARDSETAYLLSWLLSPGARLIEVEGTWSVPVPP